MLKSLFFILLFLPLTIGCSKSNNTKSKSWTTKDKYIICKTYVGKLMAHSASSFSSESQQGDSTIIKSRKGHLYNCLITKDYILWQTYFNSSGWGRFRDEDKARLTYSHKENAAKITSPELSTTLAVLGPPPHQEKPQLPKCINEKITTALIKSTKETTKKLTVSEIENGTHDLEARQGNINFEEVSYDSDKQVRKCMASYAYIMQKPKAASLSLETPYKISWDKKSGGSNSHSVSLQVGTTTLKSEN